MPAVESRTEDLREQAIRQLGRRTEFAYHLTAFVLINSALVAVWFMTGRPFFWPIFPMLGWGIGVFFHAMDVYRRPYSEERIEREMARLEQRGGEWPRDEV
ncbi:MAG TPA: 2TM domain-containing protein [Egicoccus sp.]|nr:2TM domain-containing protein [Egicoccus sp.]HSK21648.1 2TM domain-containing protein [Egicoccus sp.]